MAGDVPLPANLNRNRPIPLLHPHPDCEVRCLRRHIQKILPATVAIDRCKKPLLKVLLLFEVNIKKLVRPPVGQCAVKLGENPLPLTLCTAKLGQVPRAIRTNGPLMIFLVRVVVDIHPVRDGTLRGMIVEPCRFSGMIQVPHQVPHHLMGEDVGDHHPSDQIPFRLNAKNLNTTRFCRSPIGDLHRVGEGQQRSILAERLLAENTQQAILTCQLGLALNTDVVNARFRVRQDNRLRAIPSQALEGTA